MAEKESLQEQLREMKRRKAESGYKVSPLTCGGVLRSLSSDMPKQWIQSSTGKEQEAALELSLGLWSSNLGAWCHLSVDHVTCA